MAPMRFVAPDVPFNEDGWGPCTLPEHLKDVPYAPYGKNERLGRSADFTSGGMGGKYHDKRGISGINAVFNFSQADDEDSFHLVDSKPVQKPKYGKRPQRPYTRRDKERDRERELALQGGPAAKQQQQPKRKDNWSYYNRQRRNMYKYAPSVDIRPEWAVIEQIQLSALNKLSFKASAPRVVAQFGALAFYDKTYDRVTPRSEIALRTLASTGMAKQSNVTASEDPIFQRIAALAPEDKLDLPGAEAPKAAGEGAEDAGSDSDSADAAPAQRVFVTDGVLATLMCAPRCVYSWDILVTKQGGNLFLDKRPDSAIDEVSVSETSPEPIDPDKDSINGIARLAKEATVINEVFPQQVLKLSKKERLELSSGGDASPFAAEGAPDNKGRVYKAWGLGGKYDVFVRCDVDGAMESKVKGQSYRAMFRALNEFDPRVTGVDWRQKIENQRGAVLATELKNNSNKLSKWTAQAVLSGVDVMKLGYVTRVHHKDNGRHAVIGTQEFKPKNFAMQINLNMDNCWGILHALLDVFFSQDDGTFLIFKDPNRPFVRLYETPKNAFDSNYTEELLPEEQVPQSAPAGGKGEGDE